MKSYIQVQLKLSRKQRMKKNRDKYQFFTWVLDYLMLRTAYDEATFTKLRVIENGAYTNEIIDRYKESDDDISAWLQEMQLIGLVHLVKDENVEYIKLTNGGIDAIKKQTFHVISAQLTEAYYSRQYGKWAFYIAGGSILLTIISLLL